MSFLLRAGSGRPPGGGGEVRRGPRGPPSRQDLWLAAGDHGGPSGSYGDRAAGDRPAAALRSAGGARGFLRLRHGTARRQCAARRVRVCTCGREGWAVIGIETRDTGQENTPIRLLGDAEGSVAKGASGDRAGHKTGEQTGYTQSH